jgi:hydroxyacid-oxoacid transhydrogenase
MPLETTFTMDTSSIKYGEGSTREVGYDMQKLGAKRVMVVTDPKLAQLESVAVVMEALAEADLDAVLFSDVHVEPTDESFKQAIAFAQDGNFDGYVAVGGGSSIDTAKIANLYATHPADLLAYVNKPIGEGRQIPGPVKPLIAIPTTAGTGSETTGVAIFDLLELKVKTGISHRYLRPNFGILDPNNTKTMPPLVAASTGLDVLCHAIESLTTIPYNQKQAPSHPTLRPPYQGANPLSDIWSSKAIEMVAANILRAMNDPDDTEARSQMILASAYAGIGFGNAGVHYPHAMSYPVSGNVKEYVPDGYPPDEPMIPHGMSVILNAPPVFRFTAKSNPERHLYAASLMGVDVRDASPDDAGDILADALIDLMQKTGVPNGLSAIGFTEADIDTLVAGTLKQERLTKLSPIQATESNLRDMLRQAMKYW